MRYQDFKERLDLYCSDTVLEPECRVSEFKRLFSDYCRRRLWFPGNIFPHEGIVDCFEAFLIEDFQEEREEFIKEICQKIITGVRNGSINLYGDSFNFRLHWPQGSFKSKSPSDFMLGMMRLAIRHNKPKMLEGLMGIYKEFGCGYTEDSIEKMLLESLLIEAKCERNNEVAKMLIKRMEKYGALYSLEDFDECVSYLNLFCLGYCDHFQTDEKTHVFFQNPEKFIVESFEKLLLSEEFQEDQERLIQEICLAIRIGFRQGKTKLFDMVSKLMFLTVKHDKQEILKSFLEIYKKSNGSIFNDLLKRLFIEARCEGRYEIASMLFQEIEKRRGKYGLRRGQDKYSLSTLSEYITSIRDPGKLANLLRKEEVDYFSEQTKLNDAFELEELDCLETFSSMFDMWIWTDVSPNIDVVMNSPMVEFLWNTACMRMRLLHSVSKRLLTGTCALDLNVLTYNKFREQMRGVQNKFAQRLIHNFRSNIKLSGTTYEVRVLKKARSDLEKACDNVIFKTNFERSFWKRIRKTKAEKKIRKEIRRIADLLKRNQSRENVIDEKHRLPDPALELIVKHLDVRGKIVVYKNTYERIRGSFDQNEIKKLLQEHKDIRRVISSSEQDVSVELELYLESNDGKLSMREKDSYECLLRKFIETGNKRAIEVFLAYIDKGFFYKKEKQFSIYLINYAILNATKTGNFEILKLILKSRTVQILFGKDIGSIVQDLYNHPKISKGRTKKEIFEFVMRRRKDNERADLWSGNYEEYLKSGVIRLDWILSAVVTDRRQAQLLVDDYGLDALLCRDFLLKRVNKRGLIFVEKVQIKEEWFQELLNDVEEKIKPIREASDIWHYDDSKLNLQIKRLESEYNSKIWGGKPNRFLLLFGRGETEYQRQIREKKQEIVRLRNFGIS